MQCEANRVIASAGDLVDFVACRHLAMLNRQVADRTCAAPAPSEEEQLIARKGRAHEAAFLEELRAAGKQVVDIPLRPDHAGRIEAAAATRRAVEAGAEIVHGATFLALESDGTGWVGIADFLIRTPGPSAFGDWHYEVADTKLARTARASALVQLCVYSELLEGVQGVAPQAMHAILGDGSIESFRCVDYLAYYRRVKARFLENDPPAEVYPEPVEHCKRCRWSAICETRRRADDHLSLVAGMRRSQSMKLAEAGITTVAQLASSPDVARPQRLERTTFAKIRAQAALQVAARDDGRSHYELLEPAPSRGFALLPLPSDGDVYFDMEGDPFYEGGLEYLFGVVLRDGEDTNFNAFWGHDRLGERGAFENFIDFVMERRARFPDLHVYHYASYEASALKRLAAMHATREAEVDVLLRERVLVDLFEVVRQALRASVESYSLKKIERFYLGARSEDVKDALGSVVAYERFRETGDRLALRDIEAYNRIDCESTLALHRWLLERRVEAVDAYGSDIAWRVLEEEAAKPPDESEQGEVSAILASGIDDPLHATSGERARWLASQILFYHKREAKPAWWAHFERLEREVSELIDDREALGEIYPVSGGSPVIDKKSLVHKLAFPPQEHAMSKRKKVLDPSGKGAGEIVELDDDAGLVWLKRGPSLAAVPLPLALLPPRPISSDRQRGALLRFGRAYASDGAFTRFRALGDLLRRDLPRFAGRDPDLPADDLQPTPQKVAALALALDQSYLFIQGPPGSGKTWTGARTIVTLLQAGRRVGIAASSHKAIHNLLRCVEKFAYDAGVPLRGLKRCNDNPESVYEPLYGPLYGSVRSTDDTPECASDPEVNLVAGTAWLFADERMERTLDVLVIDEAGQVSLADALAMGTSASNLILLGDPMQLAQVSVASHPPGADVSVLEHLLASGATVEPQRGIFLPVTYRMHEAVCSFVSELAYDGRLFGAPETAAHAVSAAACSGRPELAGSGLRFMPVAHEGNVQNSPEEAEAIADAVRDLLGGTVTDDGGKQHTLGQADILIVTPYNSQVRRLRSTLASRGYTDVRAGTVDKFQGQEAAVVFFSMASSNAEELPRGLEFLFDRNRLNVAVSRARALAVLVASPALLDARATSVEQLRMVNALCRFAETATVVPPARVELPDLHLRMTL